MDKERAHMSDYGENLRYERRLELAQRALPAEMLNEYGEISFATKTEAGQSFPSSDYAYVPDPDKPSTWKLRLTSTPGGKPDPHIVGAAVAALGKGFRGNKVSIPSADLAKVKAKVRAAWLKANPDKTSKDLPSIIASAAKEELASDGLVACGDDEDSGLSLHVDIDGVSATPSQELFFAVNNLIQAAKSAYDGYDVSCDIDIDVDSVDVIDIESPDNGPEPGVDNTPGPTSNVPYSYNTKNTEDLGTLNPALKAALVKKLQAALAKATDPAKKAKLEAEIKKYS
jgi:hypothetical protein